MIAQLRPAFVLLLLFTVLTGLAYPLAVTGIVVAEFITANAGLGFVILSSGPKMETAMTFAAIVMLCAIGLLLYGAVVLIEHAGRRWFNGT